VINQTLEAHVIALENRGMAYVAPHRWICSCGKHGTWRAQIRSARNGGARHVAAMERGR
jgi:hypothetical protein